MRADSSILEFFDNRGASPELLRAKYTVLSKQIPLMYAIVVINMLALVYIHYNKAPALLSIVLPAIFCTICIFRGLRITLEDHSHCSVSEPVGQI